jgi:hypothetical protein
VPVIIECIVGFAVVPAFECVSKLDLWRVLAVLINVCVCARVALQRQLTFCVVGGWVCVGSGRGGLVVTADDGSQTKKAEGGCCG